MSDSGQDYTTPPIGERLRLAREDKGLSLDDIARQTRIPVRHLQHIDNSEWSALPAVTYSVGFARAYANAVGLNGNEIGAELRQHLGATPTYAAPAVYYEPADPARVPPKSLAIVAGLIALVLVVGYLIWRSGSVDDSAPDPGEVIIADASVTGPPAVDPTQPLGGPSVAADASGPVTLTATEPVWLRVTDQGGARLYENTLAVGERYVVPSNAAAPTLLTGKPEALRVTVGQAVIPPLGPPARTIADVSLLAPDLLARAQGNGAPAGQ